MIEKENDPDILLLSKQIRDNLTFDLVKKKFRGPTPIHGSCYIASEAIYHILDGPNKENIKIKRHKMPNGVNHWWVERNNKIIDLTYDQFPYPVPYSLGKNASFLTKAPSKRCQILLNKLKN